MFPMGMQGHTRNPNRSLVSTSTGSWVNFSPRYLSPALWLDASDTSTITSSSGKVSQWNNRGSLGNFTQATSSVQPGTGSSTQNGMNVITFNRSRLNAVNQNEWKFLSDGTLWICAAVWKAGTTASPNDYYLLFGNNGASSSALGSSVYFDDRSTYGFTQTLAANVTRNVAGTTAVNFRSDNNFITANTFVVLSFDIDPSNATTAERALVQVNANDPQKKNASTSAVNAGNPTYALQIGDAGDSSGSMIGSLGELIIVSGPNATDLNRVRLRDYLRSKWNI